MDSEGLPKFAIIESEAVHHIAELIESVPEGNLERAQQVSEELQTYLQEKAEEIFPILGRDVWLNYQMVIVFGLLSKKCEEYKENLRKQIDDFYTTLDNFVYQLPDKEEAKKIRNSWNRRMQELIRPYEK